MSRNQKLIVIDGVHYHSDRPESCELCYFWKNRKRGCVLGKRNCYYLAEAIRTDCKCNDCPYAVGRPCVSAACYRDLAASVGGKR